MEWEKHESDRHQQTQPPLPQQEPYPGQPMLEGPPSMSANSSGGGGVLVEAAVAAAPFLKVMTDEQMEILQKQIAAYGTICEQLEILHRSFTSSSHNVPPAEFTLGSSITNPYCPPLMMNSNYSFPHQSHNQYYYYGQPKLPRRQRWNPTTGQLQVLERIFDQGNEAPSKERIKDITAELAKHGQIAEANVYNWFQNRRARCKKKQMVMSAISESSEEEREMASETLFKSNNGEKPKSSSEQPIVNGDPNFPKVVRTCADMDSVPQQHQPMFSMESSLKASADGGGHGGGGGSGAGGSSGQMEQALHEEHYGQNSYWIPWE